MEKLLNLLVHGPVAREQKLLVLRGLAAQLTREHVASPEAVLRLCQVAWAWLNTVPDRSEALACLAVVVQRVAALAPAHLVAALRDGTAALTLLASLARPSLADRLSALLLLLKALNESCLASGDAELEGALVFSRFLAHVVASNMTAATDDNLELIDVMCDTFLEVPSLFRVIEDNVAHSALEWATRCLSRLSLSPHGALSSERVVTMRKLSSLTSCMLAEFSLDIGVLCASVFSTLAMPQLPSVALVALLELPQLASLSEYIPTVFAMAAANTTKGSGDAKGGLSSSEVICLIRAFLSFPLLPQTTTLAIATLEAIASRASAHLPLVYQILPQFLPSVSRQLLHHSLRKSAIELLAVILLRAESSRAPFHALIQKGELILFFNKAVRTIGARLGKEKDARTSHSKQTQDVPDLVAETEALLKGAALEERFFQDVGQDSLFEDAKKLSKLCYLLMFRFDGYPELYVQLIRAMRTVWPSPSVAEMDAALRDVPTWTLSESMKAEEEEETASIEVLVDQNAPKGLLNTANDCYCNSLIQALYHTNAFTALVTAPSTQIATSKPVVLALQNLLASLRLSKRSYVEAKALKSAMGGTWATSLQQDAFEFGVILLDHVENAFKEVRDLFGGRFVQRIECATCHSESLVRDQFLTLTLTVPTQTKTSLENAIDSMEVEGEKPTQPSPTATETKQRWQLDDLITQFSAEEVMRDNDQIVCESESCEKAKRDGVKRVLIEVAPAHLIVNLARFQYDVKNQTHSKLLTPIEYGESLELFEASTNRNGAYLHWLRHILSGLSAHSGHYYCYARPSSVPNSPWLKLNDSSVAPTHFAHFSHISDDLPRDVPYLLFYVRDDVPPVTVDVHPMLVRAVEANDKRAMAEAAMRTKRRAANRMTTGNVFNSGPHLFDQWPRDPDDPGFGGGLGGGLGGGGGLIM